MGSLHLLEFSSDSFRWKLQQVRSFATMRTIVFGAGAVGSVIGGRMHQAGADVVLVARPAHVEAIRSHGLRLRTVDGEERIDVAAVTTLSELTPGDDDVIVITAKTQDTAVIHDAIERWNPDAAVVCGTNGVEHERMALRRFERVYGMVIQLPAAFEHPGQVTALCLPTNALIDVGRYPRGADATARSLAATIDASPHLLCEPDADVMVKKYAKVLINLGNVADAASGIRGRFSPASEAAQDEAKSVYAAVGIVWEQADADAAAAYDARRSTMHFRIPQGETFLGGSTWQGLAKGATSTEIDYFNGEIVLLGRLYSVPTPHNLFFQRLARELVAGRFAPGSMPIDELTARWQAATGAA